jgi:hypothetical protein
MFSPSFPVTLSAKGLAHIPTNEFTLDSEFTFFVGTSEYHCSSFIADFLSPRISRLHIVDPTIENFTIRIPDSDGDFSSFLSLAMGFTTTFDSSQKAFLIAVCEALENQEIFELLFDRTKEEITHSNVFERLTFRQNSFFDYISEIEFISSHFSDFDPTHLESLGFDLLYQIISNPLLQVVTEDSLCEFVWSCISHNIEFLELFEFLHFEFVSAHYVQEFLRVMSTSFEFFTFSLWESFHNRLFCVAPATPPKIVICPYHKGRPLQGIISYLTDKYQGNVHTLRIVNITASSVGDISRSHLPELVADLHSDTNFFTKGEPNQWICYDFRDSSVRPTHYSLLSYLTQAGNHPRNWVIEGSNDGKLWIEFDRREENNELNGRSQTAIFQMSKSEEVRMIRLRQHKLNHRQNHFLNIAAFELFGNLFEQEV